LETFGAKINQASLIALKVVLNDCIDHSFPIQGDIVPFQKIAQLHDLEKIDKV
jgi:hypothetical protein